MVILEGDCKDAVLSDFIPSYRGPKSSLVPLITLLDTKNVSKTFNPGPLPRGWNRMKHIKDERKIMKILLVGVALFMSANSEARTIKECMDQVIKASEMGESDLRFWSKEAHHGCWEEYGMLGCYELGEPLIKALKKKKYKIKKEDMTKIGTACIYAIKVNFSNLNLATEAGADKYLRHESNNCYLGAGYTSGVTFTFGSRNKKPDYSAYENESAKCAKKVKRVRKAIGRGVYSRSDLSVVWNRKD